MSAPTIEGKFGVNFDAVKSSAEGLANEAVSLIAGLANLQGIVPSAVYEDHPERLRYGVTPGMLNLLRIDGIGRKRALAILSACDALTVTTAASIAYQDKPDKSEMRYKGKPLGKRGRPRPPRWTCGTSSLGWTKRTTTPVSRIWPTGPHA